MNPSSLSVFLSGSSRSLEPSAETAGMASQPLASWAFALLPRFPLLGRRRTQPYQFLVGQPFAGNGIYHLLESSGIISLPTVVAKGFFIKIPKEVERFDVHISSLDGALLETPEVLNSIGVDSTSGILFGMVYYLVLVVEAKIRIGFKSIGIYTRTWDNVLADFRAKRPAPNVGYNFGSNCTVTVRAMSLQQAHDGSLADATPTLNSCITLGLVHEPSLAAYESLINFDFALQVEEVVRLHCQSDAVEHEPSGFLSNANGSVYLVGANAVLGIGNHPDGSQPLVQSNGTILEDSPYLDRELPPRMLVLALPKATGGDESHFITATSRAGNTIRPSEIHYKVQAHIGVRKVLDGFYQCLWVLHLLNSYKRSIS